ncbi:hypothetical protein H9L15_16175 (plasmid) [Sphingomonas daechungensis]|uniref:Uncharacterized protein n=1 Tax=Sphingomonas daechungensis TaxID=1176646 RepID=A0ABX6T407_9SPHN|nr:hypothetical protein [Sphingomonas daechungensis]QNP44616.1 hypothetical protein H9L15_16175 [Sphingomonas daechungensis]
MFMDDRTLAQIAPSGDFGNTLTINCDNPLMSAAQLAVICGNPNNVINGFVGNFPLATGAPYNPNPGAAPINFFDARGNTYNQAFFQLLRRNTEGGPRISDLRHQAWRGFLEPRATCRASSRTTPTSSTAARTTRRSTRTSSRSLA